MASRNEKITVLRPARGMTALAGTVRDVLMACDWQETPAGRLIVYAWRNGTRTEIARYASGEWNGIWRNKAVSTGQAAPKPPQPGKPVIRPTAAPGLAQHVPGHFGKSDADYEDYADHPVPGGGDNQ